MDRRTRSGRPMREIAALFDGLNEARAAVDALEASGIDGVHISLEGPAVARAASREDTRRRDARVSRYVGFHVGAGMVVGGLVGAAIGIAIAASLSGSALSVAAAGVGGVVLGGAVGGMIGGVGSIDVTPDWELTFDDISRGNVVVLVSSDDDDEISRATDALREQKPRAVRRLSGAA